MTFGFQSWKDVLDVIVVPVVLGLVALLWPSLQLRTRRAAFQRLIFRELQELAPHPERPIRGSDWTAHLRREFVHRRIFQQASDNRDFILSLPAELVYQVSQLWSAFEHGDAVQWLYHLQQLESPSYPIRADMKQIRSEWATLIHSYELLATGRYDL